VSQGPGSRFLAWVAPGPPRVPVAPTPGSGQLQGRHVSPRLWLPSPGSGAATCPCGSGSCLTARSGSGAATRRLGSSTRLLAQGSSETATCHEDELYKLQAIKHVSFIEARARVSFKALHVKGYSTPS
jgi:hypothetical protein